MLDKTWWQIDDDAEAASDIAADIEERSDRDIAIIGMAVRLPGANDPGELWRRIADKYDAVIPFPESRQGDARGLLDGAKLPGGAVSYYDGAYLEEIDKFDYRYFRLSPKEAALLSPNQRLWLETAWSAIEDAGYGGGKLTGSRTGVYVGYNGDAFHDYKRLISEIDPASLSLAIPGNLSSLVAGRISYLLDFKGPSLTVDTACSSSLVALHLAVQAMRNGECDQALVGGVKTYLLPVDLGIRIGIESSDFRARTFDDRSDGTGGGEGSAAVLLKPLGKALRDGDAVYAVIKGTAVNQDGASIGVTAPNGRAQEEVIVRAWQDAGIEPDTIGYMEAHGTGTRLGDPIEIDGMTKAFRRYTQRSQFCAVGSIKTNFGHLDTAAGIVGLIKAALALQRKQLPPMPHFRTPNRAISFVDSPVYISDELRPWENEGTTPRRAGVSAFGMSGTNAHAVLEEPPIVASRTLQGENPPSLLALSAKNEAALLDVASGYLRYLDECEDGEVELIDLLYTAHTGRGHYEYRAAIPAESLDELRSGLRLLVQTLASETTEASQGLWMQARRLEGTDGESAWLGKAEASGPYTMSPEEAAVHSAEQLSHAYAEGGRWDWEGLYWECGCRKTHLPAYPFARTRCWVEESFDAGYSVPGEATGHRASTAPDKTVALSGGGSRNYTDTELAVAQAWGESLGFTAIDVDDHYYELGGDSIIALRIVERLSERLGREMTVGELLGHPTIARLAAHIDGSRVSDMSSSPSVDIEEESIEITYPLSSAQQRIFIGSQTPGAEKHHHMTLAYVVEGRLDRDALQSAFDQLVKRHEILRTTFEWSAEGEPRQRIRAAANVAVEPLASQSEADWPDVAASFVRPFDLDSPPLLRVGLAASSPDRHLLLLDTHHLIADGATLALLLRELTAMLAGKPLPPVEAQYRDYAVRQREWAASPDMSRQLDYWLERSLAGQLPLLRLPLDYSRPRAKTQEGRSYRFALDAGLTDSLQQLAKRSRVSLHTVLYAVYALLLNRYSRQEDLIIGSLVSGRERREFSGTAGVFINFVPIRLRLRNQWSLRELLEEVQRATEEAYESGAVPFEALAAARPNRDRSRNPIYDTMLVFHNHAAGAERFSSGELEFAEYPLDRVTSSLDVKLDLFPDADGGLRGILEYHPELFREETMAAFADRFAKLAALACLNVERAIEDFGLFTEAEEADLSRRRELNDRPESKEAEPLKVHIAATFTAEPIARPLRGWLRQFGFSPDLTFAPYNQVVQFVLGEQRDSSGGYAASLLLIRPEDWLPSGAASAEANLLRLEEELDSFVRLLAGKPESAIYGIGLMPFSKHGPLRALPTETADAFFARWTARLAAIKNVYPIDMTLVASRYQTGSWEDPDSDREAKIPYTESYFAAMATEFARALTGWRGHPFKVIVVDADNTLWRGVCGEDGPIGVEVTPPYASFQQLLLRKRSEGMLLALCSKNNEADVWEVFDRNPGMALSKSHFAAWRINWEPKPDNVRALAEELNVGADSFIFVDDNPAECMAMMAELPEVLTLQLPREREIVPFAERVWAWDRWRVTEEDRARADSYIAERQRKEAQRSDQPLDDYLRGLNLKVSMRLLTNEEIERAAQLSERTNQFNLNGVRRSVKELRAMADAGCALWIVEAADRYGDYGRIGFVAATIDDSALIVESMLLSCRALGRGVEDAVLAGLKRHATAAGCVQLRLSFRRTAKNVPFERWIELGEWRTEEANQGTESMESERTYWLPTEKISDVPGHIAFYEGVAYEKSEPASAHVQETSLIAGVSEAMPISENEGTIAVRFDWTPSEEHVRLLKHKAYLLPLRLQTAVDIAELADEDESASANGGVLAPYEAPADDTESEMAAQWKRLLGGGPYGRNDHFFDAGGDSLQAATLVSRLTQAFGVRVGLTELFAHPTLAAMASLMKRPILKDTGLTPIRRADEKELYPATPAQRRMYFLQQFEPEGTAYQIPTALEVTGALDVAKFREAFARLAERHEALRTTFELRDGELFQRICQAPMELDIDYGELPEGEEAESVARAFVQPFDLTRGPLYRVGLFRLGEERHLAIVDIHHIVADGVTVNVLLEDFLLLYSRNELAEATLQYKDYAEWLRERRETSDLEEQLARWQRRLAGPLPKLELPVDAPRPAIKRTEGEQLSLRLTPELTAALNRLARHTDSTLFMVLLSAYAAWLHKLSGQSELIVGTPVSGRTHPDTERLAGVFVNPLAIPVAVSPEASFLTLLGQVKEETLGALERQDVPFEDVVERLQPERDLSRNPVFDAMFSMLNMFHADLSTEELKAEQWLVDFGVSQFDVGLYAREDKEGITFVIQYATALFRTSTMQSWASGFVAVLRQIASAPDTKLEALELLTGAERKQVVETFNVTAAPYPRDLTLPALMRRQAELAPERICAAFEGESLTYRELNARADRIARALAAAGVGPDRPVGLMAERSPEMLAGLLGILKAGGAYVPLPPDFPADRLRFMAEDAGIACIVSQRKFASLAAEVAPNAVTLDLDDAKWREDSAQSLTPDEVMISPENLAYILYTSGSTGRPKGVMIRHGSVINRLNWMQKAYPLGAEDVILQKTPYSFDVSVWELFWWQLAGAAVAMLPPGAEKDPAALLSGIRRHRATTMHFVPTMLAAFLESAEQEPVDSLREKLMSLKVVFASGEALHKAHVDRFYALMKRLDLGHVKLVNLYGPTEATVDVTVHECDPASPLEFVPIGRPIDNTSAYVLSGNRPQPIGVPGELCIGGVQLAVGYANRPDLTAERFVDNPFAPGEKMYRTGDLARWMSDGQLEYLGRLDDQVKIRGYRIELGEIERTLLECEGVTESAITVREDGDGGKALYAYVVADRECTSEALRRHCGERLPSYMVPTGFVQLAGMPLTASGKTDRKALPAPDEVALPSGTAYAEPKRGTEAKLAALWEELLHRERVGAEDHFFELGGHSLKAAALAARIGELFQSQLSVKDIFLYPTIRKLAERLETGLSDRRYPTIGKAPAKTFYPLTSQQSQMLLQERIYPASLSYHMPAALIGVGRLDEERLREALMRLAERHEALRTEFVQVEGAMLQRVRDHVEVRLERLDRAAFFGDRPGDWEAAARRWLRPFALGEAPLMRTAVIQLEPDRHLVLADLHHAVSDGVTNRILFQDLAALYEGRQLPEIRAQFKDYSEWLSRLLAGDERERLRAYWLSQFADGVPRLSLPTDAEAASIVDPAALDEGARYLFPIDDDTYMALSELGLSSGATLFMVLLASYQALLGFWNGDPDLVTGVPAAGRNHPDLMHTAGPLLHTLAVRARPLPDFTFAEWLSEVKENVLQAFDHGWMGAEDVTDLLDERGLIEWEAARHPLFRAMFVMQHNEIVSLPAGEVEFVPLDWSFVAAKLDLVLQAVEHGGKLALSFEYRSRLFKERTIAQMADALVYFLQQAVEHPERSLRELSGLNLSEDTSLAFDADFAF